MEDIDRFVERHIDETTLSQHVHQTKHDGIERNVSTLMVDVSGMKDRLARIETTLGTKPVARKRVSG